MILLDLTIVVTGAGRGIGAAIARAVAEEGAHVAVTDLDRQAADEVAESIRRNDGNASSFTLDVTQPGSVEETLESIIEQMGKLDIWINNAGVSSMSRFIDLSLEDWDFNMNVNARGVFVCSQAVARWFIANKHPGRIINIASMAGKRGAAPYLAHYVASKFAVVGLTQAMAAELAPHRILVNAVCPGYVKTDMQARELRWEAELRGTQPEEVTKLYVDDTPLGRLEIPEDVAKVVVFLASSGADFMTGQAINVTGGAWMH
jgi:meso-butanediol dehydrogenase / (S,S)-butanediol dehydrogenase / diacetyl reductase